jgi:hypothetical protein
LVNEGLKVVKYGAAEGVNWVKLCPFRPSIEGIDACYGERCGLWDALGKCCSILLLAVGVSRLTARVGGELADMSGRLSEAIEARDRQGG